MEIKELRQLTGLSQVNFGKHLNIPMRTIQDWEAGKRTPPEYVKELIEYRIKKELEEKGMREWERDCYKVVEVEFDGDLHEFEVVKDDKVIATITPASIDDMESIINDLYNGEDVDGWEDGMGGTIVIE